MYKEIVYEFDNSGNIDKYLKELNALDKHLISFGTFKSVNCINAWKESDSHTQTGTKLNDIVAESLLNFFFQ